MHAYAITDVIQVPSPQKTLLIRLVNPWGKGEWIGDWSDKSEKWVNFAEHKPEDSDDGVFHMNFDDFRTHFTSISFALDTKNWIEIKNKSSAQKCLGTTCTLENCGQPGTLSGGGFSWVEAKKGCIVFEFEKTGHEDLMVQMIQKNQRRSGEEKVTIGYFLLEAEETGTPWGQKNLLKAPCEAFRPGSCSTRFKELAAGKYKLLCCTYESDRICDFVARVYEQVRGSDVIAPRSMSSAVHRLATK